MIRWIIFLALYVAGGVFVLSNVFANYADAVRKYDPEGGCGSFGSDQSGCPIGGDYRLFWMIAWPAFGLIVWGIIRLLDAKRRRATGPANLN
jgi:hypothetical protein